MPETCRMNLAWNKLTANSCICWLFKRINCVYEVKYANGLANSAPGFLGFNERCVRCMNRWWRYLIRKLTARIYNNPEFH